MCNIEYPLSRPPNVDSGAADGLFIYGVPVEFNSNRMSILSRLAFVTIQTQTRMQSINPRRKRRKALMKAFIDIPGSPLRH